jgi:hypothetical protein
MTETYTIYLQNQSADIEMFWCFLAPPRQMENDPFIFANSNLCLPVPRYYLGTCQFNIPITYVFGAGSGSQAVGIGAGIVSDSIEIVNPGESWLACYANSPPDALPTMVQGGPTLDPSQISIETDAYDRISNEKQGWFSNQSFGIFGADSFLGMTWVPEPTNSWTVTPDSRFYVTIGDFGRLASWDEVTFNAAALIAPNSFDVNNACTVTLTRAGQWIVTEGPPPPIPAFAEQRPRQLKPL